ncbi:MAG TPA: hypothetical protein VG125_10795 [Pirellulales bacterium]|nr:hypothetical protein [Pirellulales bacterium]
MLFAPRSPTTRLAMAVLYGAAAVLGQGLHLLACQTHDHGHEVAEASHPEQARQPGAAIASHSLDEHDADQCPICQYHLQGQWHGTAQRDTRSTVLESLVPHQVRTFRPRSLDRPLGPRGPPSSSANLA